jgi:hypothetical protein
LWDFIKNTNIGKGGKMLEQLLIEGCTGNDRILGGHEIHGLTPKAMYLADQVIQYAKREGLKIEFISGYRSKEYQKELQKKWDRGERTGLKVRPADDSAHTRGNAFDLSADAIALYKIGEFVVRNGLGRWGGQFFPVDINHFDVEGR